jgi:hypothetical protein
MYLESVCGEKIFRILLITFQYSNGVIIKIIQWGKVKRIDE